MRFSIIVVALNAEDLIRDTIDSILAQTYSDFEVIVKDALSKDKTLEMIPKDPRIKVISCADKGIYDGMNQGIKASQGEYVLFMNCGDLMASDDVLECVNKAIPDRTPCIVYGDYHYQDTLVTFPDSFNKLYFYDSTICHQASYFSRDVFEVVGLYDDTMKIAADWKLFLLSKIKGVEYIHIHKSLCHFQGGGVSETEKGMIQAEKEKNEVRNQWFSSKERVLHDLFSSKVGMSILKFRRRIIEGFSSSR